VRQPVGGKDFQGPVEVQLNMVNAVMMENRFPKPDGLGTG
jgi:hypothetical protein